VKKAIKRRFDSIESCEKRDSYTHIRVATRSEVT
jgi:hypothetical protein